MATDADSLLALEGLMNEFFAPTTTNIRKREIEELLNNFSAQTGAWRHCFYFLTHSQNEYVMMYALSVFENVINRQWIGIQGGDKIQIRNGLSKFLLSHHKVIPSSIRNKLIKVIVCIARLDWPHFYPDFFSNILQLIQQSQTAALGLMLLHTTSEELAAPREDLSASRKEELNRLLQDQVPTVLNIITHILESILDKHRQLVITATPPPSPTHGDDDSQDAFTNNIAYGTSPLQSGSSLIRNIFNSPQTSKQNLQPLPPLDQDSEHLSNLALHCLAHLFSWIPLSCHISTRLLTTIFHFANFGCDIQSVQSGTSSFRLNDSFSSSGSSSLGVLAMCCINEIMSKNCIPADFEEFLLKMFQQSFHLLQRMTKDNTAQSVGNKIEELDESYVEKFTEFLRLFVSIHLRRFEGNSHFPILEFLSLLYKYTFKQANNEGLFACLDIWNVFLDYLITRSHARAPDANEVVNSYSEALESLMEALLFKIQFRCNQVQLEELDDEVVDDDAETEWQHFLCNCLEVVAKTAELLPRVAFQYLFQIFQENLDVYLGLGGFIIESSEGQKLNITAENEVRRLHCSLRDLSTTLQALGRMSEHFTTENFHPRFDNALQLVEKHAECLGALQAFNQWLAQFYLESKRQAGDKYQHLFTPIITKTIESIVPLFTKQTPEKVLLSASHLFLSISSSVRPPFLVELPLVQKLFTEVSQGLLNGMPIEVELLIVRALSNILVLAWPNVAENAQNWASRSANHSGFMRRITSEYCQIKDVPNFAKDKMLQNRAKPCMKRTLHLLANHVDSVSGEVSKTKQIVFQSLKECIEVTLALFPVYISQADVVDEIMSFYLAIIQGLRVQMGVASIQSTITVFMNLFTREQLTAIILNEGSSGVRVVEKFLQILELILQEPGSAFKGFLPTIINISMHQIYPIIAERQSPDIKLVLFRLLFELLQNKWRYFFPSSILTKMQSDTEAVDHTDEFIVIMQSFGQSFLQPDIAVFRQNLECLEKLNEKLKLYHKKIFREMMLVPFLNVLLQVLLHKSHDLLQEEIGMTIYNMAAVDFDNFYVAFLCQFLEGADGIDPNQRSVLDRNFKKDRDYPTFIQNLQRFVNDLRYYRLCNSALPANSVKL
ncbi:exportin-6-like isoform X2 [Antedon mediterranea]|uniref:exportin-6-like isoform X2 n=1 Tax=Antedon mediterranea TaxID=105859 RepID=UPI003AF5409C